MTEVSKQWESRVIDEKFQLLQYLGGGDHSAVFLTELGEPEFRKAAIKLIAAEADNTGKQLSRWDLAAKISHPHLIRLSHMGRGHLDNTQLLYLVMEYAQEDLSQILPDRSLTPAESLDILPPLLDVLADVHGKGLVHGHIKPANIMAVDDQVKISSDGLCKLGESGVDPRKPSAYDAPEIKSTGMSPAADVWSLGMTLVECLTQRLPVWEATEEGEPVVPETLPQPFFDIARHCLRRDPQRRWTVTDIKARLQPSPPAPREYATLQQPSPVSPWRYVVPFTVALALVVLAVLAVPRLLNHHPQPPPTPSVVLEQPETKTPRGGGLVQGAVVNKVLPDVSARARDTIQGAVKVTVRVAVDTSGNVTRAALDSPGPSKYFAAAALEAARSWRFRPTQVDGQNVPSEWILRFRFERTATNVVALQAAP